MTAELIIELAWKSLVVAGLTLIVLRAMRNRSAAERSWIAHAGLVATLLLPVTVIVGPDWEVAALEPVAKILPAGELGIGRPSAVSTAPGGPGNAVDPASPAGIGVSTQQSVTFIYGLPAAVLTMLLLIAIFRLQLLRRRAQVLVEPRWATALAAAQQRMGFKHGTALLVSEELRSPISWGVVRPIILLDTNAASDVRQAEAIIAHELAHVARLDWAMLLLGRLATAIFWFNPLVWLLARRCHELSEQAVDDTVLRSNIRNTDYAELLISAACHDNRAILLAANGVTGCGPLTQRVERVLDTSQRRAPARWGWIAGCCGAAIFLGAPLSALSPSGVATAVSKAAPAPAVTKGGPLEEALIAAVHQGDLRAVHTLLAAGVNVNAAVKGDGTALIVAADAGRINIIRDLLGRGADINLAVNGNGSPLIAAAASGHLEAVRYLLDEGADIEAIVPSDENALMQASHKGHDGVVRLLIARGANVNSRYGARTPLSRARDGGHRNIQDLLLAAGANQ